MCCTSAKARLSIHQLSHQHCMPAVRMLSLVDCLPADDDPVASIALQTIQQGLHSCQSIACCKLAASARRTSMSAKV